jgi:hypothetical protein
MSRRARTWTTTRRLLFLTSDCVFVFYVDRRSFALDSLPLESMGKALGPKARGMHTASGLVQKNALVIADGSLPCVLYISETTIRVVRVLLRELRRVRM